MTIPALGFHEAQLRFVEAPPRHDEQTLPQAVRDGLSRRPRSLPCRFFYDETGSTLFERICEIPEYYPTRTERTLLLRHSDEIINATAAAAGQDEPLGLIELGSGSSIKTRLLIEATLRHQQRVHYVPIDISREFLRESAQALMASYSALSVTALASEYRDALHLLPDAGSGPRLFLFLGSSIGNFDTKEATDLLRHLRARMTSRDRLLVGVDLVKGRDTLEAAYNDAAGVTEAFNKNLLARINREMGADFDLSLWEHHAPWVESRSRIEMWLISRCDQVVTLPGSPAGEAPHHFAFRKGEGIHTENSHKYTPDALERLCCCAGLRVHRSWRDERKWFEVFLLKPGEDAA